MFHLVLDIAVIAIITAIIYIVFKLSKYLLNISRLPPGPVGLPVLGVVNKLDPEQVNRTIQRWKEEYGDVYSFTLAGQSIIVVSGYDVIKEVLLTRSDEFAGRAKSFRVDTITEGHPLIGFTTESPKTRLLKKSLSTSLKMYGERLLKLEDISLAAVQEMFEEWQSSEGNPFDPQASIHDVTAKIISSLSYGKPMTAQEFKDNLVVQKSITNAISPGGLGMMLEAMPWLRFFGNQTWKNLLVLRDQNKSLFGGLLDRCKKSYDGSTPECVAQSLLQQQQQMGKDVITDRDVFNNAMTLIGAGTATTFRATHSFVAILANKPELQRRLQEEVDGAVGGETPRLADKEKMPYMEATVYELLRYISHVPMLLPHTAMVDTTLAGYKVPKDTQIWVNAFGLHHDPRYWDEPWEFKPERYLDEQGAFVTADHINRRRLLPFGAGRRVCVGEVLAKNRMFLIMAGIVQNFEVKPKSESERPDSDPRNYLPGFITAPRDFEIRAIPRKL